VTEKAKIVCSRVGESTGPRGAPAIPGVIKRCVRCGHEVTVTPAGVRRAAQLDAEPLCMQCFRASPPRDDDELLPLTPEQAGEIRAALGLSNEDYVAFEQKQMARIRKMRKP